MDAALHRTRRPLGPGLRLTWTLPWRDVPDGTFVVVEGAAVVVVQDHLARWDAASGGYGEWSPRPSTGDAEVLTPRPTVAVLASGYAVQVDASAH